ncbi:MAG: ribose-phosphate diphosphokinase, partial [Hyphomicrobiales bacterium]
TERREALRREGASRLVLVAPYIRYMPQDSAFLKGQAISQRVVGLLLTKIVDRIITIDAHLHRTSEIGDVFPGIEADNLSAMPAIADRLRTGSLNRKTIIVGPDAESRPWVSDLAGRLGLTHAVAQKTRRGDRAVEIEFPDPSLFAGRPVLMVDDIVSSGGTLIACAKAIAAAGATAIDAIITHALFSAELGIELTVAGIRTIRSTHSVPHPTNAFTLDETLLRALSREMQTSGPPASAS